MVWRLQVGGKLDSADKETIEKAIDETIEWLDSNQSAEVRFVNSCSFKSALQHICMNFYQTPRQRHV